MQMKRYVCDACTEWTQSDEFGRVPFGHHAKTHGFPHSSSNDFPTTLRQIMWSEHSITPYGSMIWVSRWFYCNSSMCCGRGVSYVVEDSTHLTVVIEAFSWNMRRSVAVGFSKPQHLCDSGQDSSVLRKRLRPAIFHGKIKCTTICHDLCNLVWMYEHLLKSKALRFRAFPADDLSAQIYGFWFVLIIRPLTLG